MFPLFDSFLFLFSQPQSVSFSQLSVSFLYKTFQIAFRGQPGVHVNYMNVIFTGKWSEAHQGREPGALWPPLPYTELSPNTPQNTVNFTQP